MHGLLLSQLYVHVRKGWTLLLIAHYLSRFSAVTAMFIRFPALKQFSSLRKSDPIYERHWMPMKYRSNSVLF